MTSVAMVTDVGWYTGSIRGDMAVQSWADLLKASRKTALIHDGGCKEENRLFWSKAPLARISVFLPHVNSTLFSFCVFVFFNSVS